MKRWYLILLCLSLLLSGCGGWADGSYVSVQPHQEQSAEDNAEGIEAENASQLQSAMEALIERGTEQAVIAVPNYPTEQLQTDSAQVIRYLTRDFPVGAYAVDRISYDFGTSGGHPAIALRISYVHTRAEIRSIKQAGSLEEAKNLLYEALDNCESGLVMQVAHYRQTDFTQLVADYCTAYPEKVMEQPEVSAALYPESAVQPVVELKFTYQTSRDTLRNMKKQVSPVFDAAVLYVSGDASDHTKLVQLYSFLMERFVYQQETSITPAYSLLRHGVGDSRAFATVYAAMCRLAGLECQVVTGTRDGAPYCWNMVRDGDRYCHVDLLRSLNSGGMTEYADSAMSGYVWDYSRFPACEEPEETQPEEPTVPETTADETLPEA